MSVQNNIILHIANDYAGSKVYKNLVSELDQMGIKQTVYTAVRDRNKIGNNRVALKVEGSTILYSAILNWHIDRALYPLKIVKIYKDIQSKIDFNKVKCIHAHTWYSDGGVAYLLSKKYDIPFIIAVRDTDINLFQKKLIYVRPLGRKIINKASKIIIISKSYKNKLLTQKSLVKIKNQLKDKLEVIPNGVDSYWVKNRLSEQKSIDTTNVINILYIGTFLNRKQILNLQKAIISIDNDHSNRVKLHLVGGGGDDESAVLQLVQDHPKLMTYHGEVHDKATLKDIFQSCDIFAMPSLTETFGLVYVEAMLQGMPILYTEGQGIDGFYNENIGEKVSNHSVDTIKKALKTMIDNPNKYSIPISKIAKAHDWNSIARQYESIYRNL
ncbi:glycosyltransferase family 4 protein [Psychrobacter sp. T6-5]|uniref:glycosyltransferase family 4 protein n=1 Tax=Psychrobacter sp. T6-5 TaxID=3457451 RepID=UPI003FCFD204